ncbi:MAG: ABC transporter substrate-binding protein [Rubrivivax sp.]
MATIVVWMGPVLPASAQGVAASTAVSPGVTVAPFPKVLRYAFRVAETNFDPAQVNDIYSRTVTPHIFEALYGYDHLARPPQVTPLTARGAPEISADFRLWTIRLRPGIYFAPDPAFGGPPRELTAHDYVYSFKRFADPALKSPSWPGLDQQGIVGLAELRRQALEGGRPFDYDRAIDGVQALDDYTIRFRLQEPRPRFLETLATGDLYGAVAREVVEAHGTNIGAHPVGTGPFRLAQWRRSSLIVLERNPDYRPVFYDADPAPDDAEGQALLARFKGRRLPMLDRVEISIIEEEQPRWLSFLQGQFDFLEFVPPDYIDVAMPNGAVAPNLRRRGIQGFQRLRSDGYVIIFNMEDPMVGGYDAPQVALRRALGLALDVPREIQIVYHKQALPSQSPVLPGTTGYDATFKSEAGDYDPARAKALLDLYGFVDRNGDGWRERPDGSPLRVEMMSQTEGLDRQLNDLRKKNFDAVGVHLSYKPGKWPENLKAARAGHFMSWRVGSSAASEDGQGALARLHGKQIGGQNMARFSMPAFDEIYERMEVMPDGPERLALFERAKRLAVAYMPYKPILHRVVTDLAQPALIGYRRPLFWTDWWQWVDMDPSATP